MNINDMIKGLVRAAELKEQDEKDLIWDDESREALAEARQRGWGRNKVGKLFVAEEGATVCQVHGAIVSSTPDRAHRKYCPQCVEVYQEMCEREQASSLILTPPPVGEYSIPPRFVYINNPPATPLPVTPEELKAKKHELFEARFDGELAYDESPLTVRVWVLHEGPLCNDELVQKQRKFNEMMEVGHLEGSGPELKDIARMISTMLGGATVELTTNSRKLGKLGIVYYPEWP